jgi:hypothetical protein
LSAKFDGIQQRAAVRHGVEEIDSLAILIEAKPEVKTRSPVRIVRVDDEVRARDESGICRKGKLIRFVRIVG